MTDGPWSFQEARTHLRSAAELQHAVVELIRNAFREAAIADEAYRKALAAEQIKTHNDGVAWTACGDLARGDETVAKLRRNRDIAEGNKEAILQLAWARVADRKDAQRFADWSQNRELAEFRGEDPER